jgi:hypothetical protein
MPTLFPAKSQGGPSSLPKPYATGSCILHGCSGEVQRGERCAISRAVRHFGMVAGVAHREFMPARALLLRPTIRFNSLGVVGHEPSALDSRDADAGAGRYGGDVRFRQSLRQGLKGKDRDSRNSCRDRIAVDLSARRDVAA